MTIVESIDEVRDFLVRNVCPNIKLLKPSNQDGASYKEEYVTPEVFPLYMPKEGTKSPNVDVLVPSIVVQFMEGSDDTISDKNEMKFILSFATWRPGTYESTSQLSDVEINRSYSDSSISFNETTESTFTRNNDGWKDVWNFVEIARQEIKKKMKFGNMSLKRQELIKYGIYTQDNVVDDFYPKWYAWMSFTTVQDIPSSVDGYDEFL